MKKYKKPIQALVSILGLVLLLVWMEGGFTSKTPPGTAQAAEKSEPVHGPTAKVESRESVEVMRWPATVSARSVAQIAPKIPARIVSVTVQAGDALKAGQVVAMLDPTELRSRVDQARSGLAAAQAESTRTASELRRTQNLFAKEAATQQSLEASQAAARSAEAQVAQAKAAIATAESLLGETVLKAPFDGTVVKRNLEPGDMAQPGTPVITVQTSQKLRVEAAIPENCARALTLGQSLKAQVAGQSHTVKVEEIAPAADPQTRTVLVKAGLEGQAQPGAFAWIEQACGKRSLLLVPAAAVSRSGQLESVRLLDQGQAKLRHVRTGKTHDGFVEVLSGLKQGDVVLVGGGK